MSSINFYLDKASPNKTYPIFLVYQDCGRRFKYSTKEKVLLKHWDKKKQRAKGRPDASEINDYLDHLNSKLKTIERQLRITKENFTFEDVKNGFLEKKKITDLFDFFEEFIENSKATRQVKSLKEYRTIINDLKEFQKKYRTTLTFSRLDYKFFNSYLSFLVDIKENSQNTIAKKVSTLKTMLNYATKAGANSTMNYKEFKIKKVKTEKVFLTREELKAIHELDLSDDLRLERVRDVFCFGCFTGLRYSDIKSLKYAEVVTKTDLTGKTYKALQFHVQKTRDLLVVPLNNFAIDIISKYEKSNDFSLSVLEKKIADGIKIGQYMLPVISNQKMNEYIKEVAKQAEIDTPIVVTRYSGVNRKDELHKKYELLSTHAARRTFAVLSLENGMRIEVLQKLLGHKDIKTTMKYVYILEGVKNQEMQSAWNGDALNQK